MQFFGVSEISPSPPAPTASGNNGHMMYVFNRNGVCLLYREWNRPLRTLDAQQDQKLMFGLLFSLKSLTAKMDPTSAVEKGNLGMLQLPGQGCSFHSFCTNTYKLSFMESPSGIKVRAVQYNVGPVCERHCIDAELFPINTVDDLCGFNALFCMVYVRGIA
ncbi:Trafficking protein particle complex subunit 1 [Glycine soja]|nr:Trafficking protein particle complex subunit 1 [Glycine soja]